MERIAEKIKIDSFTLKMIAMLSMLADHIGAVLFPIICPGSSRLIPPS